MTNPLVAFGSHHKCRARGFAGGGSVDDAKAVGDRMCKEYGVGCKPKAAEAPAPAPQAQVAPSPAANSGGMIGAVKNIFANRAAQIDKAAGYAFGGAVRDGSSFTQDLTNYNPLTALSGPKDRFGNDMTFTNNMKAQMQDIAAPSTPTPVATPTATTPAAIPASPTATPTATPQNPLTAIAAPSSPFTGAYAPGSTNDPRKAFSRGGMIKGPGTPTSDSIPAKVEETGEEVSVSTDERILSKAQDEFLEKLAQDLGFDSLEEMLEAGTGQPVGPTINANQRGAATGGKFDENRDYSIPADQLAEAQTAIAAAPKTAPEPAVETPPIDPEKRFQTPDFSMIAADRKGYEQARQMIAPTAPTAAEASRQVIAQASTPSVKNINPLTTPSVPRITHQGSAGTPYSPPSSGSLDGTGRVGNADVKATQQEGIHRVNVDGKSPLFTNLDTETALKGLSTAKSGAPSISSVSIDAQNPLVAGAVSSDGPSVVTLRDSGKAEHQALWDKWSREDNAREMVREMERNPKAANALASLYHSQQGAEASLADSANRRDTAAATDETNRRGQDIEAQTRAMQFSGNPIDNALKRTQLASANMAIDKAREQDKVLANIHAETDPAKRQALIEGLLAGQGKNVNEHRFIKVDGGEETNDLGVKYKKPSGVFDAVTKQFIPMGEAPKTAPTYAQFAEQMKARYPGKVTDNDLKAAYAKQFGAA